MNSGYRLNNKTHLYSYIRHAKLRTHSRYKAQVKQARILKLGSKAITNYKGIKGKCWFSKFCSLPDAIATDFMHLLGLVKQLLGSLLTNKSYLGKNLKLNGLFFLNF